MLCGFVGLATDVGMIYFDKTRMQAAADSAVLAGAQEGIRGNWSSVTSAAQTEATANGYTNGVNGATVTVNNPPVSGDHNGDSLFVETIVARAEPTFFMKALGISSINVSARAVAGLADNTKTCVYVLDGSANNALEVSGGGALNVPCAIVVNSTASQALVASGGSCITATEIDVTGNYSSGCYTPTPTTGVTASDDPLVYLTAPTAAATCDAAHTNYNQSGGTASLSAGTYCGGINLSGGGTLNLGAGTYILKGGGLTVQATNSVLNGTGVTFYNTCSSGSCSTSTTGYAAVQIKSKSTANLTAPTSGSLAHVLIFADRSAPAGTKFDFSGSANLNFSGTMYAVSEELDFSGASATSALNTQFVARLLNLSGTSTITLNQNGTAIKQVEMVE
jgi:hypothetical protein